MGCELLTYLIESDQHGQGANWQDKELRYIEINATQLENVQLMCKDTTDEEFSINANWPIFSEFFGNLQIGRNSRDEPHISIAFHYLLPLHVILVASLLIISFFALVFVHLLTIRRFFIRSNIPGTF